MILKSQKLVEQFNVSCRFKLLNLILRKHVFSLQFKVLLQRKNSRILVPGITVKETSDTFPYLHFLDKHISPRATKNNLVERREESDHEDDGDGDNENDDMSYMETSSAASAVEDTESESTSPKAGSSKDHVSDSSASKQKQPKPLLSIRKSKQTTTKVDVELEVMKVVGEGLKTMCSRMQQQPQAAKEEKDEDDLFGVFVASQLKCMDQSRKAKAKYHINNMIFQVMMSGTSGDRPSGFMQDLNRGQGFYLG